MVEGEKIEIMMVGIIMDHRKSHGNWTVGCRVGVIPKTSGYSTQLFLIYNFWSRRIFLLVSIFNDFLA